MHVIAFELWSCLAAAVLSEAAATRLFDAELDLHPCTCISYPVQEVCAGSPRIEQTSRATVLRGSGDCADFQGKAAGEAAGGAERGAGLKRRLADARCCAAPRSFLAAVLAPIR